MISLNLLPFKRIVQLFPGMASKLTQAGVFEKPEEFIRKSFMIAFYLTTILIFLITGIFIKLQIVMWVLLAIFPLVFLLFFMYLLKRPDVLILKKKRDMDQEIVYAARFLVIELESGVPIYDAMKSVSRSYPVIGKYFREIINRVDIGTPMDDAINESIERTPSQNFRRFLWQIFNSLKTGADLSTALSATIDQIADEQIISVKEYGRKLNPLVMFYMVVAVIFPSIGIIMLIVFSTFFSIKFGLTTLLLVAFVVGFLQYIFLTIIRSTRPAVGT